ncbi:hypothetical protein [Reyranella sp. CPCC 100927]|uniref:hypothetical protein n=1 Tax=Reyranella sp. CPCC 100927 TaxID=2599616 RepID=UPI0011B49921|nr:hypothetical protein [Reyranella sp. CPCC 100927]TWS96131.1 hypothetical protein FQU96_39465 [Reyranella sp. CPCC 100927]
MITAEEKAALERLIGQKAKAFRTHEKLLAKEISKGAKQTAFHTISRHGYQTGWEAQLVRLMTSETPDQPFALTGVRGTILQWDTSGGDTVTAPGRTRNIRYAEADSVGAFLNPEVEVAAINAAVTRTADLRSGMWAEMITGHGAREARTWCKYKYIEIIVHPPFEICGISFVRDQSKPKRSRDEFETAFKDYLEGGKILKGKTVSLHDEMVYRQAKAKGTEIPAYLVAKMQTRFPNLSDLLDYLHVQAISMKNVRLVLKRVPDNSVQWKLHTAYAVNQAPMIRPDAPGRWNGRIKSHDTGPARLLSTIV